MKKLLFAATLLLAISGIGFAQTAPSAKPAAKPVTKTETAKTETKPAKKSHASHKKTSTDKAGAEKKS